MNAIKTSGESSYFLSPNQWTITLLFLVTGVVIALTALILYIRSTYYETKSKNTSKSIEGDDNENSVSTNKSTSLSRNKIDNEFSLKNKENKLESSMKPSFNNDNIINKKEKEEKLSEPTSVLRGYPEVDLLILSPCQRFLFICCYSKRKARIYPQNSNRSFMSRGKELQEKYFISVDEAVINAIGDDVKVEIRSASFSYDGTRLAVGERNSDTIFVFSIGSKCQLTLQSLCKLPNRRLVSSLPQWNLAGTSYEFIVMLYDKNCEVEVLNMQTKEFLKKDKFKVGNALAWAQQDITIAVAGSFLREVRVATLQMLPNGSGFHLQNTLQIQSPTGLRVLCLALLCKGIPEFNTRDYLVLVTEDGAGSVYDIAPQTINNKTERRLSRVGEFHDDDAFDNNNNNNNKNEIITTNSQPPRLACGISGTSHHERLSVALTRHGDVAVFRQSTINNNNNCNNNNKNNSATTAPFKLSLVRRLRGSHEGDAVGRVVFVQNCEGLATSGGADGRHIRLWELPPLEN